MHVSLSFEPERIARILAGLDAADWDEAIPDTEMNDVHPVPCPTFSEVWTLQKRVHQSRESARRTIL